MYDTSDSIPSASAGIVELTTPALETVSGGIVKLPTLPRPLPLPINICKLIPSFCKAQPPRPLPGPLPLPRPPIIWF